MGDSKKQHWITFLVALAATLFGGLGVVLYQQWTTPAPGLAGRGELSFYVPLLEPGKEPELKVNAFWTVTVRNAGQRPAKNVRLRVPPTDITQFGPNVKRRAELSGPSLNEVVLGDLDPGQEIQVAGWANALATPLVRTQEFALSHSEGYGVIEVNSIDGYRAAERQNSDLSWWELLVLAIGAVVLIAALKTQRENREFFQSARAELEAARNEPEQT